MVIPAPIDIPGTSFIAPNIATLRIDIGLAPLLKPRFKIIGTSRKNVDGKAIVTGKPMFAMDKNREGMLFAMIAHPPAFGMKLKSVDTSAAKAMPGIRDVFPIKTLNDDYERQGFDTNAFPEMVAIEMHTEMFAQEGQKGAS